VFPDRDPIVFIEQSEAAKILVFWGRMSMYSRPTAAAALIVTVALGAPLRLEAQSSAPPTSSTTASLLDVLARERQARWASASPVIHCGPAPLTERPEAAAEHARPAVLPLETAFVDAINVKRLMLARVQPVNR
jgi:hypothetical protein